MDKNKSHNIYTLNAELGNNAAVYRTSTSGVNKKNGRFPYASTPSVSPSTHTDEVNENISALQLRKSNMKLLVGSLAQSESFCGEEIQMEASVCNVSRRYVNVTSRNRYLADHNSTAVSISPIAANNDPPRQLFSDKGETPDCRQQSSIYIASRDVSFMTSINRGIEMGLCQNTSNNSASATTTVYPYPTITDMDSVDSIDILSKHLQILAAFRTHELQRQQLTCPKRKDKGEDKFILYKFTKETFLNVNTEASILALYLLFNNICSKEFEQRFRDCWPVYEKKLEGAFRRAALEWMKELIEANPSFFHGIRVESLGGLLVNPGGERFVSMMRQLCRYVMYLVATRKQDMIRRQILLPPIPMPDPEITNRQLHVLQNRVEILMEDALKKYKSMVINESTLTKCFEDLDTLSEQLGHDEATLSARLKNCVINHPSIFNILSDDEWEIRDAKLTLQTLDDQSYEDILKDRIDDCLERCADEVYKPVSFLQNILKDYDNVWYILETDKTKPVILDCDKFPQKQIHTESGSPSLNTFINNLIFSARNILPDLNSLQKVPKDILGEYDGVQLRMNYLNMLATKVRESSVECKDATSAAKENRECVKLRLDGFPWSTLSKIPENGSINHLDMTPMRVFDINRVSGRTPGMNNFLDSSSSCSSGDNTTVVKRGRASKTRREGEDSTDGSNFLRNKSSSIKLVRKEGLPPKSLGSDRFLSTPVSTQENSVRSILQQSCMSSLYEKSLCDTPVTETSLNASSISISGRLSIASTITTTPTLNAFHDKFDSSYSFLKDTSCISTISDFDTSGVNSNLSAHERVSKILESIANKTCDHEQNSTPLNGVNENVKPASTIKSKGEEIDFSKDELNVTEDWRGIMETSHILYDSDSDD